MKINELVSTVTKMEGKKVSVSIGNVREILRVLRDICRVDREAWSALSQYVRYCRQDGLKPKKKKARALR